MVWLVVVVRDIRVRIKMAVVVGSHAAAAANREGIFDNFKIYI